jgi:hypothetical protein
MQRFWQHPWQRAAGATAPPTSMQRWWQLRWQPPRLIVRRVPTNTDDLSADAASQRALRARMAAYTMHAAHDSRVTTRNAREAFMATFERQVDPDGTLPMPERLRRAEALKKAYFVGLAMKSAKARRTRKRAAGG